MKLTVITISIIFISVFQSNAQMYRSRESANVYFGGFFSDIGGGAKVGYSYLMGNGFFLSPAVFGEWGRPYQAKFSSFGADAGIGYSPFWFSNKAIFNLRLSATGMYDILSGLKKHESAFSYGAKGGAELEYYLIDESMTITLFGNQAYLLKNAFGNTRYEVGVMLKFTLY